jgi:hypothetical protein
LEGVDERKYYSKQIRDKDKGSGTNMNMLHGRLV